MFLARKQSHMELWKDLIRWHRHNFEETHGTLRDPAGSNVSRLNPFQVCLFRHSLLHLLAKVSHHTQLPCEAPSPCLLSRAFFWYVAKRPQGHKSVQLNRPSAAASMLLPRILYPASHCGVCQQLCHCVVLLSKNVIAGDTVHHAVTPSADHGPMGV